MKVKDFLIRCYEVSAEQGAYKLTGEQQAKVCIQAYTRVLREVYHEHGERVVLRIITSDSYDTKNMESFLNKPNKNVDTLGNGSL